MFTPPAVIALALAMMRNRGLVGGAEVVVRAAGVDIEMPHGASATGGGVLCVHRPTQ
jgi:hypothetical protein